MLKMKALCILIALCFAGPVWADTPLRLSGSTTVKSALEPKLATLESAVGRRLEINGTGTEGGMLALVSGAADVAMLAAPLDEVVAAINAKTPGHVGVGEYHATRIGDARTVFVVHEQNKVRTLSSAQVADLLTGKVRNWAAVGGADAPVIVISLANGGSLLDPLLHGSPITPRALMVPNAAQIPVVVAQEPNAIGIISAAHPRGNTLAVTTDTKISAPLFLVTRGKPTGDLEKLVAAAKVAVSANMVASSP